MRRVPDIITSRIQVRVYDDLPVSASETIELTTSEDGTFHVGGDRTGYEVRIVRVECDGYEYDRQANPRDTYVVAEYKPDQNHPEIIHLRKRQPGTHVIESFTMLWFKSADQKWGADLFAYPGSGEWLAPKRGALPRGFHTDVTCSAVLDSSRGMYEFTVRGGTESSGVLVSDEKLYTAPEGGYGPAAAIAVPSDATTSKTVYVFVRSRQPAVYARLDVTLTPGPGSLEVSLKGASNPYGQRNLELDEGLLGLKGLRSSLSQKAETAFQRGNRPSLPDLPKLIAEAGRAEEAEEHARRATMSAPASQPEP